jgi:predicted transcriptional regulator
MKTKTIQLFDEKEAEFVQLLVAIGTKRTVANVLVFLANTPEASSRDIERGTDLRQPEVSIAIQYLTEQSWISVRETKAASKGRPVKIYTLAKPISQIIGHIEREKEKETTEQLALIRKMKKAYS